MYRYIVIDTFFNEIIDTIWADSAAQAREEMNKRDLGDKYYALYVKVGD